jgi:hypothetical protein
MMNSVKKLHQKQSNAWILNTSKFFIMYRTLLNDLVEVRCFYKLTSNLNETDFEKLVEDVFKREYDIPDMISFNKIFLAMLQLGRYDYAEKMIDILEQKINSHPLKDIILDIYRSMYYSFKDDPNQYQFIQNTINNKLNILLRHFGLENSDLSDILRKHYKIIEISMGVKLNESELLTLDKRLYHLYRYMNASDLNIEDLTEALKLTLDYTLPSRKIFRMIASKTLLFLNKIKQNKNYDVLLMLILFSYALNDIQVYADIWSLLDDANKSKVNHLLEDLDELADAIE